VHSESGQREYSRGATAVPSEGSSPGGAAWSTCPVVVPGYGAGSVQLISDPRLTQLCGRLIGAGLSAPQVIEQMRANETRMTDLQDANALINATPIELKVAPNPALKGLLTDLNDVEAAIRRINASKIAPGAGAAAEAGSISGMLRTSALQYGSRK